MNLEPEHLVGPEEYIADSRNKGIDDITTIERMEEHGWRSEVIVDALEHTRKQTGVLRSAITDGKAPPKQSRGPNLRLIGGIAAVLLVMGVGFYLLPRHEEPAANAQIIAASPKITDKNYQLTLPAGWLPASDNTSGAGVNIYYQPGQANTRKSRLTVFVTPAGANKPDDRAVSQITNLRQNGGKAETIRDEAIVREDHTARLQVVRSAAASNPDDITYYAYLSMQYGETHYHADAMVPGEQWNKHEKSIIGSVLSIKPTNKTISRR